MSTCFKNPPMEEPWFPVAIELILCQVRQKFCFLPLSFLKLILSMLMF